MTVAETFAEFATEIRSVPESARAAASRCLFDLVGCAAGGYATQGAASARRAAARSWGSGKHAVWFSGQKLTAPGAAFCNAAMSCQLDLDDGHRAAAGHPGASVIPAAFTALQESGSSRDEFLEAICIGYEVALRIASSRDIKSVATTDSGQWCGSGASIAAAVLRRGKKAETAHAIAIGGTTAPGQWATPYTRFMGNNVKEGIPAATANGLLALDLACEGFTGPIDIFDNEDCYNRSRLLGGLGTEWMIEGVYFKPYSACRWCHAPVDAIISILKNNRLSGGEIDHIRVETFGRALTLNNDPAPATIEAAQYSIPYCLGLAATSGSEALLPMRTESLASGEARRIARLVELVVDPELDAMFSAAVPARVVITARGKTFSELVLTPKGEPSTPLNDCELAHKARALFTSNGHASLADRTENAFRQFTGGDIAALQRLLADVSLDDAPVAEAAIR